MPRASAQQVTRGLTDHKVPWLCNYSERALWNDKWKKKKKKNILHCLAKQVNAKRKLASGQTQKTFTDQTTHISRLSPPGRSRNQTLSHFWWRTNLLERSSACDHLNLILRMNVSVKILLCYWNKCFLEFIIKLSDFKTLTNNYFTRPWLWPLFQNDLWPNLSLPLYLRHDGEDDRNKTQKMTLGFICLNTV